MRSSSMSFHNFVFVCACQAIIEWGVGQIPNKVSVIKTKAQLDDFLASCKGGKAIKSGSAVNTAKEGMC